jgi:hypothetical protein
MAGGSNGMAPEFLRWVASVITMGAGLVLAARLRPRLIGWAFVVLTVGSLIWIGISYLSSEYALMAQNIVLTLINLFGIYRWLIWKGKI